MNLDQFFASRNGLASDYDGAPANDPVQCVDLIKFYLRDCHGVLPGAWGDARQYFTAPNPLLLKYFQPVANDKSNPNQVPPRGAIIVWGGDLPGSGGAGHVAIAWDARPGSGTFVSFDQNWGGKSAKLVTHNWSYVIGWLIPRSAAAPQPAQEGIEMIATADQARRIYRMLRPNSGATEDEVRGTAGHRSYVQFLSDAEPEMNNRDAALRDQAAQLGTMQTIINQQNQTITDLTQKLRSSETTAAEKSKALSDALQKLGTQNADLATAHDTITDLQKKVETVQTLPPVTVPAPPTTAKQPSLFVKFLLALAKRNKA